MVMCNAAFVWTRDIASMRMPFFRVFFAGTSIYIITRVYVTFYVAQNWVGAGGGGFSDSFS